MVVLFGPETPHLFAATTKRSKPLRAGIVCSPCVSALNNREGPAEYNVCMQRISVDRAFGAFCDSYEERACMRPGVSTSDPGDSATAPLPETAPPIRLHRPPAGY